MLSSLRQFPVGAAAFAIVTAAWVGPTPIWAQTGPVPPAAVSTEGAPAAPQTLANGVVTRFIRVTGYGVVQVKPGEAHISFLVSAAASNPVVALRENADQVSRVLHGLTDAGVPKDNITWSESSLETTQPAPAAGSTGMGMSAGQPGQGAGAGVTPPAPPGAGQVPVDVGGAPAPSPEPGPLVPPSSSPEHQYTANARVEVLTYVVGDASAIVQIGMAAGATSVLGMTFQPRGLPELKQQALTAALKDAASKAELLSIGVRVRVLYAISVSEVPAPQPDIPGGSVAPPALVSVPMAIDVVYAIG